MGGGGGRGRLCAAIINGTGKTGRAEMSQGENSCELKQRPLSKTQRWEGNLLDSKENDIKVLKKKGLPPPANSFLQGLGLHLTPIRITI